MSKDHLFVLYWYFLWLRGSEGFISRKKVQLRALLFFL